MKIFEITEDASTPTKHSKVRFSVSSQSDFELGFTVSMMVDGKPVGSFRFYMDLYDGAQHSVEIHSDYRRRGYGTLLLLKTIETAVYQMGEFQSDIRGVTAAQDQLYHKAREQGLITPLGLGTYDITDRGLGMLDQAQGLAENFADGKVKGKSRPGRAKRAGVDCGKSITDLRKMAKNSSGEKQKMAHWCANMKSGRKKKS